MLVGLFFDRQHPALGTLHITIAAGALGQGARRRAVQCLPVQLLIRLVDEHHAVIAQAKRTTAVLVHPAAHAETVGGQAMCLAVTPVPDAASGILRAVFVPEQAERAVLEFGEIHPGGHGEGGAEWFNLWR